MVAPPRLVPLEGAFNFRDLGGYATADGRQTQWGRLFRSDALHELSRDDLEAVRALGIRTVLDLRTERELLRTGRGPLEGEPIGFHHLAVIPEGPSSDGEAVAAPDTGDEHLADRYLWYLDVGASALTRAFHLLGSAEQYPLVFHCAAGKDRTGVVAAMILDLCGVDHETIVADYVITGERIGLILARYQQDPRYADRVAAIPPVRFSVNASSMEGFLAGIHSTHGGSRAWLEGAGVPAETLDRLVAHLLD